MIFAVLGIKQLFEPDNALIHFGLFMVPFVFSLLAGWGILVKTGLGAGMVLCFAGAVYFFPHNPGDWELSEIFHPSHRFADETTRSLGLFWAFVVMTWYFFAANAGRKRRSF
ncbi:MAG: hypothetical protein V4543_13790 [Bacteroidota bacterium]